MLAPAERGRPAHRFNDSLVGAAATHVSFHVTHNLFFSGFRSVIEQGDRGKNHSRRAVTTLECLRLQERPLHGMECFPASQAFNGSDLLSDSGAHLGSTRSNRPAIK